MRSARTLIDGAMSRDRIVHEIEYRHPPEDVWDALTDPEQLAEWLMVTDFAPRLGQRFRFFDRRHDLPDSTGVIECEVVELNPPTRLAYTWQSPPVLHRTLVTWTLRETATGTRVRLEHSGFLAGGPQARSIRDYLEWGWGSLLRDELAVWLARTEAVIDFEAKRKEWQ